MNEDSENSYNSASDCFICSALQAENAKLKKRVDELETEIDCYEDELEMAMEDVNNKQEDANEGSKLFEGRWYGIYAGYSDGTTDAMMIRLGVLIRTLVVEDQGVSTSMVFIPGAKLMQNKMSGAVEVW